MAPPPSFCQGLPLGLLFSLSIVLAACQLSPTASTGVGSHQDGVSPALISSAPGGPETEMTWEGCQQTPGCSGDDSELATIHDGDLSFSLFDANLPDPSPGADGIWIGWRGTDCYLMYAGAAASTMIDQDHDGLRDECEHRLAVAFSPLLNMSAIDGCPAGEPYWAAKFIENLSPYETGDMVKIAYMPAYHDDCGDDGGHNADSEFIQLTVAYNPSSQHWELVNSWLSAHSCNSLSAECVASTFAAGFSSHSNWGPIFEFPSGRPKSFPRVYVSRGKHANYRSREACSGGGAFGQDDCAVDTDMGRFRVWQDRNVGSARFPLRDCVTSTSSLPQRTGTECFWSGTFFAGWRPWSYGVTPYSVLLTSLVFQGTMISAGTWWTGSYGY